ncbi:hypothetical protein JCM18918_4478 [Cutibacterium acnes JCM 18918]|nr:hypothetical protein JCM18918_4478 [Cutibacterium acnes JCM 18918]
MGVFITALTVLAGWLTLAGRISVGELVTVVGLAQTLGSAASTGRRHRDDVGHRPRLRGPIL